MARSAHNIFKYIIAALVFTAAAGFSSSHAAVLSYGDSYNYPIPHEPDTSKGLAQDAILNITDDFIISDLDVEINITHGHVFDLQVNLISPAGTNVCLTLFGIDEFFFGQDYIHTIFDDEALVPIGQGDAPFTGRFRPRESLDAFDGESLYGQWRLIVEDLYEANTGTLNSFELHVTTPEPTTLLLFTAGFIFVKHFKFSAN